MDNQKEALLNISNPAVLKAGGKAAGLHRLIMGGLNVPDAYVLLNNPGKDREDECKRIWKALNSSLVAARSSASDEDGKNWSAAGQYDSVLNISSAPELLEAVETCTRSLHSLRADHYRTEHSSSKAVMNVLVQKMITPRFAGVFFTDNPLNPGRGERILEAVRGEGEALVSGEKAAMRYIMNADMEILSTENPGNQEELDALLVQKIAREASDFADREGYPQDLEWCIDEEGCLYWLQSRPITTEELPECSEFDYKVASESEIFTRCNIGEMIPGAVTPLTRDCFAPSIEYAMQVLYGSCGGIHKGNRGKPFVVSFSNHLIFNMTTIYGMAGSIAGASKESIEMNILGKTIDDPAPYPPASRIKQLYNALRYFSTMGKHKKFLKQLGKLKDSVHFTESENPEKALHEWRKKLPLMDKGYALHMLVSGHSGFANSLLTQILERMVPDLEVNDSLLSELLSKVEGVESAQAVSDLEAMALEIKKAEAFKGIFRQESNHKISEYLLKGEDSISRMFRAFMDRHGHRCIREAEFRTRGWEEEPENIIANLKEMVKIDRPVQTEQPEDAFSLSDFQNNLPQGSAQRAVKWALAKSRTAVAERELSKSLSIRIQFYFKKEIRRIAEILTKEGILPDEDLVYFFTAEELGKLFLEDRSTLIKKAEIRRRLLAEQSLVRLPEIWRGQYKTEDAEDPAESGDIIKGTPVSIGKVRGRVCVITNAAETGKLKQGDIMVAPLTDIGWTPYYSIAGGMITEIGSALSHGSVIAREYGLPLVSNITAATGLFKDGDYIEIDGRKGTVRFIEEHSIAE